MIILLAGVVCLGLGCGDERTPGSGSSFDDPENSEENDSENSEEEDECLSWDSGDECQSDADCCSEYCEGGQCARCGEDELLVTFQGEDQCRDICTDDGDCASDEECDGGAGVCLPDQSGNGGDNGNGGNGNGGNGNGGSETCQPEQACEEYCYEKSGRCIEESCSSAFDDGEQVSSQELADMEMEVCKFGVEAMNASIQGCIDEAELSTAACEGIEDQADQYATQECSNEQQVSNRCGGQLMSNLLEVSETVLDACGCEPANAAETCTVDADCDNYGRGLCDDGTCTADCNNWDGAFSGAIRFDPTCADDQGLCTAVDSSTSLCFRGCTQRSDCPQGDQGCLIVGGTTGSPPRVGACLPIEPAASEQCFDNADCGAGEGCFEGNCVLECQSDSDCPDGGCGSSGICEIDFIEY